MHIYIHTHIIYNTFVHRHVHMFLHIIHNLYTKFTYTHNIQYIHTYILTHVCKSINIYISYIYASPYMQTNTHT